MILVDTSVWIDFLNGTDSPEGKMLHRLIEEDEDIAVTGIILTEVLQGLRRETDLRTAKEYLLEFPVYEPASSVTYVDAARIYRECRGKGRTVRSTVDCIIAAICLENDLAILHKDSDYDIVEECAGLKVLHVPAFER